MLQSAAAHAVKGGAEALCTRTARLVDPRRAQRQATPEYIQPPVSPYEQQPRGASVAAWDVRWRARGAARTQRRAGCASRGAG
eukprot:scaffold310_cov302-Prasinococcus_capsulatus_cf.AAC.8